MGFWEFLGSLELGDRSRFRKPSCVDRLASVWKQSMQVNVLICVSHLHDGNNRKIGNFVVVSIFRRYICAQAAQNELP